MRAWFEADPYDSLLELEDALQALDDDEESEADPIHDGETHEETANLLTAHDAARAARLNRRYARTLAWDAHRPRIAHFIGFTTMCPDERAFAQGVARWQRGQGMLSDGVIGPETWPRIRVMLLPASSPAETTHAPFVPTPVEAKGGGRIEDRTPPREADVETVLGVGGKQIPLHRFAAAAWRAMVSAARSSGLASPLLLPTSGFRSPERQKRLWNEALAKYGSPEAARRWVAPPGGSAHQSGRAVDLYLGANNSSKNVPALRRTPAYKWLVANAERFGFYPYPSEPWHWEYNPPAR